MKNLRLPTVLLVLLVSFVSGLQAQTAVHKPDQVKLIKQLYGIWQGEIGKDTVAVVTVKPFGTGLDCYARVETKGKITAYIRQLFGYDKQTDQFIEAEVTKGSDMELWAGWFSKDNLMIGVPYANRLDPSKSVFRVELEFKSPDTYVKTVFKNGKRIGGAIMKRKKG